MHKAHFFRSHSFSDVNLSCRCIRASLCGSVARPQPCRLLQRWTMSSLEASQTLRHQVQPLTALGRYSTSCVLGLSPLNTALDRGSCTFNNNHYFSTYRQLTCLHRYYVLVATCVFLRKHEWLRNACLAAALVVPSISALHGIVLTSYHVNGQFQFPPRRPTRQG